MAIITLDALHRATVNTLFNPLLTAPLLAAITFAPEKFPESMVKNVKYLKTLVGLGVLRRVNSVLNDLFINNFTNDTWDWPNEIAIVTGGSGGFGQGITLGLAKAGLQVVILDIVAPKYTLPSNVVFYETNICSSEAVHEVAEKIRSEVGNPTILINNAGVGAGNTILKNNEKAVRLVFDVNTISHFWLCKEFLPFMTKKNHGHIVTIASMASYYSTAQGAEYYASKSAALAFHEVLAQELKHRYHAPRVRMTSVHPYWARTNLAAGLTNINSLAANAMTPDVVYNAVVKQVLSGRGAQIILPWGLELAPLIRGLPNWIQELARDMEANMIAPDQTFNSRISKS